MQSVSQSTIQQTTTPDRSLTIPTTSFQHGIEILDPFDAGPHDDTEGAVKQRLSASSGGKGKGREEFDVIASFRDEGSLPGSESPDSPGERVRIYESKCVSNRDVAFAVSRKDVAVMDYSLIDNVPNGTSLPTILNQLGYSER